MLLLIYLLALARFCTAWAAMETGSAFEGMGAAREVSYAVLAEAAMIAAVLSLSVQTGSVSLVTMLSPSAGRGRGAAGGGLVHRAAGGELPRAFDDPNTHLELTMVHEAMVLDHSGPPLAVILHGASMKLLLFAVLLVQAVLPIGQVAAAGGSRRAGRRRAGRDGRRRAGGIAAGAVRVPPRAAAADDGISAVFVCLAGGMERRCGMSRTIESA